jgi:hypothetical protein
MILLLWVQKYCGIYEINKLIITVIKTSFKLLNSILQYSFVQRRWR